MNSIYVFFMIPTPPWIYTYDLFMMFLWLFYDLFVFFIFFKEIPKENSKK